MNISRCKASRAIPLEKFADRLLQLMPRIMHNQVKQERNYLTRGIITLPQLWVLRQVAELGTCSMHTLAQAQGLKASTVTGLADRLVKLGLLKRLTSETDRRVVLAVITPKGRKIMVALHSEHRKSIIRMFQHISPQERVIYLQIIEKIGYPLANLSDKTPSATIAQRK
ncbi:MAG: MarR family transcriptional regulator [Verrucomicrobia bacterium]|nr:MarR family transcriptional regulator [Verrucomicrobiota bacterium]MCG2678558.1 MarR family transcriptional regulator [Kiritimatiellia bacterium]MBU4247473.1 MarR family transcriptional regulator [Verrucomicrobiota bacterium]MBU4292304.1 MarR family transcriptional regulator [Verrucomicrobiota bacterium]MBU4430404.1 MarR family transcriptional regulator [Verrucomicrobiota bacterium]